MHRQNSIRKCTIYRDFGRTCINLNILECKFSHTYLLFLFHVRINLNILECKSLRTCLLSLFRVRINLNILECKLVKKQEKK